MQRSQYQMEASQGGVSLYSTQGRGDRGNEQEKDLGLCTFSGRLRTVQHWLQGPGLPASVMFRVYARWINCLPYTAS